MTVETVVLPGKRAFDDTERLLAASCMPLPDAVFGLVAAQNARDLEELPAGWSALDSFSAGALAVLSGALALVAVATAVAP